MAGNKFERRLARLEKAAARQSKMGPAQTTFGRLDYEPEEIRLRVDSPLSAVRLSSCEKEPWTVTWLEECVGSGDVVYDIGANVGPYALIAAGLVGPTGTVVAFEPAPSTLASLSANLVANSAENVVVMPHALSDQSGEMVLSLSSMDAGAGVHYLGDSPRGPYGTKAIARQRVVAWRLDELVGVTSLPKPSHIKIDVDGAELDVLRGAGALLEEQALRTLLVEMEGELVDPVTALLDEHGFALTARFDRVGTGKTPAYGRFERA